VVYYLAYAAALAVSIGGVAFFAGSETSFISSNRFQIRVLAKRGVRGAAAARKLLENPATLLSATLVGTNIFTVLASVLVTHLLGGMLGTYSVLVATVGVTALILVFGEITPKAIARNSPEAFLTRAAIGLKIAYYVLYPVAKVSSGIGLLLARLTLSAEKHSVITRDEIRALVKEASQADLSLGSYAYAHRILDLSRMKVTEAMLPMDEVVCIDDDSSIRQTLEIAAASGHSRYPVFKRGGDIVGILHVKDLLGVPVDSKVKVFVRSGYYVPETKTVKDAVREMRDELKHLAIVTDEYGRPIGILTFEDLVEKITGEIRDEYDHAIEGRLGLGRALSGSTPIAVVNEELGTDIPRGAYDTIAGFILDRAGKICGRGDVVAFGRFRFHVVQVRGRRIRQVMITERQEGDEAKTDRCD
jgi:CBS domain containing-hemolysin-like protein